MNESIESEKNERNAFIYPNYVVNSKILIHLTTVKGWTWQEDRGTYIHTLRKRNFYESHSKRNKKLKNTKKHLFRQPDEKFPHES